MGAIAFTVDPSLQLRLPSAAPVEVGGGPGEQPNAAPTFRGRSPRMISPPRRKISTLSEAN